MTPEELEQLAESISQRLMPINKDVLSLEEAALYLGIKKSYLYKLTADRKIPHSKPGGKVIYFEREALDRWMLSNPVITTEEISRRAQEYCLRNPLKFLPRNNRQTTRGV